MSTQRHFDRYPVRGMLSVAALLRGRSSGIYVLEFENGEQYVGQALSLSRRFSQHRHGGKQHLPWMDISWISVLEVPREELNLVEQNIIAQRRAEGISLRNKTFNFGNAQPSSLDEKIPVIDQRHWACGDMGINYKSVRSAVQRPQGATPKLFKSEEAARYVVAASDGDERQTVASLVVKALAYVIKCIPNAVELEGKYWTITDYPSTGFGRFATLNVGSLEVLFIPRQMETYYTDEGEEIDLHVVFLNLPAGSVLPQTEAEGRPRALEEQEVMLLDGEYACIAEASSYQLADTDRIQLPLEDFIWVLESSGYEIPLKCLILDLMRSSTSSKFARWHSTELARRSYEVILEGLV